MSSGLCKKLEGAVVPFQLKSLEDVATALGIGGALAARAKAVGWSCFVASELEQAGSGLLFCSNGSPDSGASAGEKSQFSTQNPLNERFYEKVIKVKADVAALRNLFSDVSIDVRW